jgi:hydrogenase maturation protease
MQTECLMRGPLSTTLGVEARFLHLWGAGSQTEAVERAMNPPELLLSDLVTGPRKFDFAFSAPSASQKGHDPDHSIPQGLLEGARELSAKRVQEELFKLRVRILNLSPYADGARRTREEVLRQSFVSTHTILQVQEGQFISLLDPPEGLRAFASGCSNQGTWPVLVGEPGQTDLMLSAPIILYDYPRIAPESPGDLFDATEIDEVLTLRILTMTDQEKQEMSTVDERAKEVLHRTEALDRERRLQLHGALREIKQVPFRSGDRVRLRPRGRADVFDLVLEGKIATIASVEQDYEDRIFLTVIVDDDPGNDLGVQGKPGHRFFFRIDEVEPIDRPLAQTFSQGAEGRGTDPRILIAGIGNIFLGDDAFGVEVIQRMAGRRFPEGVQVSDFGIRGFDLAYALQDGYDAVILVDSYQHGNQPGSLCVIEPDLNQREKAAELEMTLETHGMDPLRVFRWVQATGGRLPLLRLVGCEPALFGPEEGQLGLSEPVQGAVDQAVKIIESLVADIRNPKSETSTNVEI